MKLVKVILFGLCAFLFWERVSSSLRGGVADGREKPLADGEPESGRKFKRDLGKTDVSSVSSRRGASIYTDKCDWCCLDCCE